MQAGEQKENNLQNRISVLWKQKGGQVLKTSALRLKGEVKDNLSYW